jgi:hypothetical protein
MLRRYKYLWAIVLLVAVLVAVRAALPSIVKDYVNDKLQAMEAYDGHVEDVDMALWRGAYRVEGIRIVKTGAQQPTPFFSGDSVDFSVEWRSLLRGSLVAEGEFLRPNLNMVQARNEQQSQTGKEVNWPDQLEQMFPFRFNTVRVKDGTITFRAPGIRTQDALKATRVSGEITNITNVVDRDKDTFADFRVNGQVLEKGTASVNGSVNPLARSPTFDVNLAVKNVQLPDVNPWLRQYIKADAESGEFELYTELAAAEGKFKGYAKPIMRKVNIYSSEEPEKNPLKRLWEGLVEFAANIFENEERGQVAARIPFSGTIKDPEAGIFATIVSVMRNAFVSAFARSLEGSISLRDVKQNLQGIGEDSSQEKRNDEKRTASKDEKKAKDTDQDEEKRPRGSRRPT